MSSRIGRVVLAVIAVAALESLIPTATQAQAHDPGWTGGGSCHQVTPEVGPTASSVKAASIELRYWSWLALRLSPKPAASRGAWSTQYSRPVFAPVGWRSTQR